MLERVEASWKSPVLCDVLSRRCLESWRNHKTWHSWWKTQSPMRKRCQDLMPFTEEDMLEEFVRQNLFSTVPGHKVVGCKWVFKTKLDENGQTERYKAWLVAQGFSQIPGVDFDETLHWSHVTRHYASHIGQSLPLAYSWDECQIRSPKWGPWEWDFHEDTTRSWGKGRASVVTTQGALWFEASI